jgi:hypothetical protein
MAHPKVNTHLSDFTRRIDNACCLVNEMREYKIVRGNRTRQIRTTSSYKIIEMAFLEMFLSWEEFLELAFIKYMCGAKTNTGYHPKRYVFPPNIDHAQKFLLLNGKKYSDWTNPQDVIQRAETVFEGGQPFALALRPSLKDLENIRTIRNAIAHQSGRAWQQFTDIARNELGYTPRGIVPGMFLQSIKPSNNLSFFDYYRQVMETASSQIVR